MSNPDKVKVTSKRQITLPAAICRLLGIDQGDQLEVDCDHREIRLRLVPRFPPLSRDSMLFRMMGAGKSSGPEEAETEDHDRLLAQEASALDRRD